jgi:hypothetical protein
MLVGVAALAMAIAACGSDDGGGSEGKVIGNQFGLAFSPIYTAFDGQHDFRVPIVPQGGVVVDNWEIVDAKGVVQKGVADFTPESSFGGVTLKTNKAGEYFVLAHAGKQTGCAKIHIAAATPAEWTAGEARYNNSIMLTSIMPTGMMPMNLPKDLSCKNCHGEGAMFLAVEHTPQQTAGYTDEELAKILTMGMKPTPPDPTVPAECTPFAWMPSKTGVPLALYRWFHTWTASPEETAGLVLYLRSLPPKSQGALDFGGLRGGGGATMPPAAAAGGAAGAAP